MNSLSARLTGHLKYLFLTLAMLILLGLAWYLLRPLGSGMEQMLFLQTGPEGTMVTDPSMVQFEGRETRWTLNAKSAIRAKDDNVIIEQPHLEVFHTDGRKMEVTSRQGAVNNETRAVIFHGGVEAMDGPLNRLTTDWLRFDPNARILYTDQAFRLEGEEIQLEGVGFTLNQETRILRVQSKVKVMFNKERVKENGAWGS
ncbi:MAG: LPS export ABC transporter periplasmic protein LptC [Magnetococcales bacterium]|nr:LPS export ABC transporter periplasmic protein LptC [Magnetococcales bacterium]MBF0151275.1 LPS export ABC transporter periplasmic protein LptC [Magnetococcales bacterium]MBF0174160.1 LPS export ABC transporter periplasmic protein LptC [Magnetococcales bacterium]MBF0347370.1 LPS export ABC transporter periplasmic protein LptC [Magnetococcales bacterium]MBF0632741.1 LPS export ABC transporter periplasmic protein LptC [Magnetococcales bacterium]